MPSEVRPREPGLRWGVYASPVLLLLRFVHARLLAVWDALRSSYWFIPSLMALGAIALSFVTTAVDEAIGPGWIRDIEWLHGNRPEGARALLSTVAGSMIGVAGVTFSITIASVVYASGQYGPRLLTNFMRDRGNQITLGTFISTFLYCLLVLRTIRAPDEPLSEDTPAYELAGAFVPHIAVLTAVLLALASIAVFIYFIHHVPESIHVSNVIAGVGHELRRKIDTLFPERIGEDEPGAEAREDTTARADLPDGFYDEARAVAADGAGYVQGLDGDALLALATEHDLLLRLRYRPGDFIAEGDTLVLAWPAERVTGEVERRLRRAFAWGRARTAMQDTRFLINELVEIAARALSPSMNDPFTAIACLDWLGAALKELADRRFPSARRLDEDGHVRLVAEPTTFGEFVDATFGQLRPYVSADRNAALHTLRTLGEVAGRAKAEHQRAALRREADALLDGALHGLLLDADKAIIRRRHQVVVRLLSGRLRYEQVTSETDWVGGTA